MPKVSVIMPLYNAQNYIKKAVDSILKQTFRDFELILINDCSTDQTMEVVSGYCDARIKVIENEHNLGIAASRNRGLENSSGKYIALMDDDDLAALDRFEKEVSFLEQREDIDVVGARYCVIDENDRVIKTMEEPLTNPDYIKAYLMFYDPIANGSTMFRQELVMKNGVRFQENCFGMEDYRFWIDCSLHGRISNINEVLLYWRCWENETYRNFQKKNEERANCYRALQKYALERNGYQLNNEEMQTLNDAFSEELTATVSSVKSLERLYQVFQKIILQAEEMEAVNKREIKIMCRKLYSRRLEFSEIWK